jgi:hypothetical protein
MTDATERQVKQILTHPFDHEWTLQGFGMLRTYLDPDEVERLHIWDLGVAVPDVSTLHNHPWDFSSRIVSGRLLNQRFDFDVDDGIEVNSSEIRTGEGGSIFGDPRRVKVRPQPLETYGPGELYAQEALEFHESFPEPGTVTVIKRRFSRTRDYAVTCWRTGDWVSAEPRPATRSEIAHFVSLATG